MQLVITLLVAAYSAKIISQQLYFWQLKEYRWDRLRAFFKTAEFTDYWFLSRKFYRPRFTLKATCLFAAALGLTLVHYYSFDGGFSAALTTTFIVNLLLFPVVFLGNLLTRPFAWLLILLAKRKLAAFAPRLLVIGITGSYGKSATKEILTHLLSGKFRVCQTPANHNTLLGVAFTVLKQLSRAHQIFVVEMGAYRRGEIARLARLVQPRLGILTGINQQHLGLFGSLANIAQAKYELIQALPARGLAVFNGQDRLCRRLADQTRHVAVKVMSKPARPFTTNLSVPFLEVNLQLAVAVARHLKVPARVISRRLASLPDLPTGLKLKTGRDQSTILDDSYNANPSGFAAAVAYAATFKKKPKILVFPGIIELGDQGPAIHQALAQQAFKVFHTVILTKADFVETFSASAPAGRRFIYQADLQLLLAYLRHELSPQTLILFSGRQPQGLIAKLLL